MSADPATIEPDDDDRPDDFSLRLVAIISVGPAKGGGTVPSSAAASDSEREPRSTVSVAPSRVTDGHAAGGALAIAEEMLAACGGRVVSRDGDGLLARFDRLAAASAFARGFQARVLAGPEPWPAVGINLGALRFRKDGRPGADVAYAIKLRRRAAPGEIYISAVATNKLTSRVRADGRNEPPGWRVYILPAVGLFCFLGYYFGWFYAIYWRIAYYVSNDQFPCWPEFMCR